MHPVPCFGHGLDGTRDKVGDREAHNRVEGQRREDGGGGELVAERDVRQKRAERHEARRRQEQAVVDRLEVGSAAQRLGFLTADGHHRFLEGNLPRVKLEHLHAQEDVAKDADALVADADGRFADLAEAAGEEALHWQQAKDEHYKAKQRHVADLGGQRESA